MIKTIGLYARCSTDKQDLITQKSQLSNFLEFYKKSNEKDEVAYIKEYFDEGYSGANQSRPKLQELLKDLKAGRINTVIIVKLDRLARTLQDLLYLTNEFKSNHCQLIVIKDNIDTSTPSGLLFFHILSAFIEFERSTIVQRMRDGRERAESEGSKSGKPCHRPKKDINIEELRLYHKQGLSLNNMAKIFKVTRQTIKKRLQEV